MRRKAIYCTTLLQLIGSVRIGFPFLQVSLGGGQISMLNMFYTFLLLALHLWLDGKRELRIYPFHR